MSVAWGESTLTIRRAELERDWDELSRMRDLVEKRARDWEAGGTDVARGLDRLARYIDADQLYLIISARSIIACHALTPQGDPAFWSPAELAQDALYLDNAMVHPAVARRGVGSKIVRHARDEAVKRSIPRVRLDCQRVLGLRAQWERLGFAWVRDVVAPGRSSGTLMERTV